MFYHMSATCYLQRTIEHTQLVVENSLELGSLPIVLLCCSYYLFSFFSKADEAVFLS